MMFYSKIRSGVIHDQSYSKKIYWIEYLEIAVHTTQNLIIISAHADGGPHSCVCARATLRSAPHRHEQKFFRHTCLHSRLQKSGRKVTVPERREKKKEKCR